MNIKSLTIKNVKSFGEEVKIDFQNDINIFIGPNAGGKSNLMDILNITLVYFFVHTWKAGSQPDEFGGIRRKFLEEHLIFEPINRFLEKHLGRLESNQQIKITFVPEKEDVENIENIKKLQAKLIEFEKTEYGTKYLQTELLPHFEGFDSNSIVGKELEFLIENNNPIQISNISLENKNFFNYLRFFNLIDLLIKEYNESMKDDTQKFPVLYPPLAYFSPYRISQARNLMITLSAVDYFNLIEKHLKSDSKSISSSFEIANYFFAKKLRYLDDKPEIFQSEEEIKMINTYIEKLGYKNFGYECKNKEKNIYEGFLIRRDGSKLDLSKASGGEKEIINFLLGIFALNVKNGVVIIDEPELHLHPKWQRILLELLNDFTEKRGIQFFIVTHSPHFITQESIKNVIRVYAKDGESNVISPPTLDESEKDLFQIVNVFNNTKIFFADKVVLAEGDVDNIIFSSIMRKVQIDMNNTKVIEVLDVKGKDNFKKFLNFLKKWQISHYIIADLDYLFDVGDEDIKVLFQTDYEKIDKNLRRKGSKDGQEFLKNLEELLKKSQLEDEDLVSLKELSAYLTSRYRKLKENLSQEEKRKINEFIEGKYKEKIYILKEGEVENYFDGRHFDINKAIQIAKTIENQEIKIPTELKNIFKKIIED